MGLVLDHLARLKIFLGNGQAYVNDVKYPLALVAVIKIFVPTITILNMAFLVIILFFLIIIVGWFDLRFIKLHQKIAEISTRDYNPYFNQLEKSLKGKASNRTHGRRKKRT